MTPLVDPSFRTALARDRIEMLAAASVPARARDVRGSRPALAVLLRLRRRRAAGLPAPAGSPAGVV